MIEITEQEYKKLKNFYEKAHKARRKWEDNNKEWRKQYMKKWQQDNREHLREYQKKYYKKLDIEKNNDIIEEKN